MVEDMYQAARKSMTTRRSAECLEEDYNSTHLESSASKNQIPVSLPCRITPIGAYTIPVILFHASLIALFLGASSASTSMHVESARRVLGKDTM